VRRYGGDNDTYAEEARKFVTDFEKGIGQYEVYAAYGAKNYAKAFEIGRPLLKTDPENFFVLGVLAEAGYENALAGNANRNDESIDYLRRAIQLLDVRKVSKADPFKSVDAASGFLNLALGWFLKDKAPVDAGPVQFTVTA
jgi:tetratricopeptide (TPR) repeat protein